MPFLLNGFFPSRPGKYISYFLSALCLFLSAVGFAQYSPDAVRDQAALEKLRDNYMDRIGEGSLVYNGVQYIRNGQKTEGFPFFESEDTLAGTVWIDGFPHRSRSLQLDLVTGQLITRNFPGTSFFVIEPSLVDSFVIDDHLFISLPAGKTTSAMHPGYYECVRALGMQLYIYWEKKLQTRPGYDLSAYLNYDRTYILKDDALHLITGKKELLDLMGDHKDEVKKLIRSADLNFNKKPAEAVRAIFRHYQTLTD